MDMTDTAFYSLVVADVNGHATEAQATWLRSADCCMRWHSVLESVRASKEEERASLDQWLLETEQRTLPYGATAQYALARQEHARRVSSTVQFLKRVKQRITEANAVCLMLLPPLPPPPRIDVPGIKPDHIPSKHDSRLQEVKQELAQTKQQLNAAKMEIGTLQAKLTRAQNHVAFLGGHATQRKQRLYRLQHACWLALRAEENRKEAADFELLTTLRDALLPPNATDMGSEPDASLEGAA